MHSMLASWPRWPAWLLAPSPGLAGVTGGLTEREAVALYDSGFWRRLSDRERAAFQLREARLCMPLEVFHRSLERSLRRPVRVEEMLAPRTLLDELRGRARAVVDEEWLAVVPAELRQVLAA